MRLPVTVLVTCRPDRGLRRVLRRTRPRQRASRFWGIRFASRQAAPSDPSSPRPHARRPAPRAPAGPVAGTAAGRTDLGRRGAIAGFDQQFAAACRSLLALLAQAFEALGLRPRADGARRLLNERHAGGQPDRPPHVSLGAAPSVEHRLLPPLPSSGRSYFLKRLLRELVFAEQHLGSRARLAETARTGAVGLLAGLRASQRRCFSPDGP